MVAPQKTGAPPGARFHLKPVFLLSLHDAAASNEQIYLAIFSFFATLHIE